MPYKGSNLQARLYGGASPLQADFYTEVKKGNVSGHTIVHKYGHNIAVPITDFWRSDITIRTTYGNSPTDARQAIDLLQAGYIPVERMITHRLPLAETQKGFELVAEGRRSLKVIIHPQE